MPYDTIRSALRAHTSATHQQLDLATGHFDSLSDYGAFVRKTYRFRGAVEPALAQHDDDGWAADALAPIIALDLTDLGLPVPTPPDFASSLPSRWARLGAHYVLEGSSLGARLLVRRAAALGMSASSGARHLDRQATGHDRWRAFLVELDVVPPQAWDEALDGAEQAFAFALSVYSETASERA